MFYAERERDPGILVWEADFLPCFAAGDFEGCFVEGVCFTAGKGCLSYFVLSLAWIVRGRGVPE